MAGWLRRYAEHFALALIALTFGPWLYATFLEPRVNPVTSHFQPTSIAAHPKGAVMAGTATRFRDCQWLRTEAYLGRRGEPRVPVTVEYLDPPTVREVGEQSWEGIITVGITPGQVARNMHMTVVYACWPWPFDRIELRQPFYDGLGQDVDLLDEIRPADVFEEVQQLQRKVEELAK